MTAIGMGTLMTYNVFFRVVLSLSLFHLAPKSTQNVMYMLKVTWLKKEKIKQKYVMYCSIYECVVAAHTCVCHWASIAHHVFGNGKSLCGTCRFLVRLVTL